ncbi:MAG: DUF4012 domain-containing protein [Actinobacteria bacterium]|nr:DUF4012 domain-containing protein [Actinomycetota bacterium]
MLASSSPSAAGRSPELAASAELHENLSSIAPGPAIRPGAVASLPTWLRSRRRQLALAATALLLVAVGVLCSELVRIRDELEAGANALDSLELTEVEENGGLAATADDAADHLDEADRIAHESPLLRALSVVPGLDGQVDGLRSLTESLVDLGAEGRRAGAELEAAIDGLDGGGAGRLALVDTADEVLARLQQAVDRTQIDDRFFLPPLAGARDDLREELDDKAIELTDASRATALLSGLLTGPRRYLIAVGNNAEMRSLGAITATGVVNIDNGELAVGPFLGNLDTALVREGVPVPTEYTDLYGWRGGMFRYPGTVYTPNFPQSAQIIAALTARNVHGPVDGVIYVDTITLKAILEVVGPVTVEGRTYAAEDVVEQLLYRNYLEFQTISDHVERKSLQSEIATAAFDALNIRDYSVFELAESLSVMARSRHFLGWSSDPAENELWQRIGADGHLEPDDVLVEVGNLGSSKLDFFVTVEAELTTEPGDYERRATLAVTITNPEREETSPYIEGVSGLIEQPGEHVGWLLFFLPQYARSITAVDFPGFGAAGPDGPLFASGVVVRIPVGESRTYTISFDLPILENALTILPAARIRPTAWTIDGVGPFPDYFPQSFDLDEGEYSEDDRTLEEPAVTPP